MKILISAHRLQIGGTQVNAVELAAELRDRHGFDVVVWATPGPLLSLVEQKRLPFVAAPDVSIHPSLARMRALQALVRKEQPDLVHAWDWWQALDAFFGLYLPMGVPLVISDMMMELTRVLPMTIPTTFGTPLVRDCAALAGWRHTDLLLPPVDTEQNSPDSADGRKFRQALGLGESSIVLVTVSRLAGMKADSLERSIRIVGDLGRNLPLSLVIVGNGTERSRLEALGKDVNMTLGRDAVAFTGSLVDPRPAYAAADVIIGMGGSALRGMAFGKPVIVVGDGGFADVFSPETEAGFYRSGMYGWSRTASDTALRNAISMLAEDRGLRDKLGKFGRAFVAEHHSLGAVSDRFARFARTAAALQPARDIALRDAARMAYVYVRERRFWYPSRDKVDFDKHLVTTSTDQDRNVRHPLPFSRTRGDLP